MRDYRLLELKLEVNKKCPLNCLHCSSNGTCTASEQLPVDRVVKLVEEFANLGGKQLCISGGEPLWYEELPVILKACTRFHLEIILYTSGIARNGSSLKPIQNNTLSNIADVGGKLIFSLHGSKAIIHDKLTQVNGSFNTTITAIERTKYAGLPVELHVVPTRINYSDLPDISKLAASLDIEKVSWLRFVPQGRGFFNRHLLQLTGAKLVELNNEKKQAQSETPAVFVRTGAPFNVLCPDSPGICEAGRSVITVTPDGKISPCDAFKQFQYSDPFGNILNHSLFDIWHKSRFLNDVRCLQESRANFDCKSCDLFIKCKSGCLAQKAVATGTLSDGKDPDCPLSKIEVVGDEIEAVTIC